MCVRKRLKHLIFWNGGSAFLATCYWAFWSLLQPLGFKKYTFGLSHIHITAKLQEMTYSRKQTDSSTAKKSIQNGSKWLGCRYYWQYQSLLVGSATTWPQRECWNKFLKWWRVLMQLSPWERFSASSSLGSIIFSKMYLKDLMYMLERFKQHFKVEKANQSSICNNKAIT
jgi:hypothetical protein